MYILRTLRRELIVLALVLFAFVATAQDVTVTLQFTATNFAGAAYVLGQPAPLAPNDPVSGTIVWQASSINAPLQSFDSINLTIANHSYSVGELSYEDRFYIDGTYLIGCTAPGGGILNAHDNFWMMWYPNSLVPYEFAYTAGNTNGEWSTSTFTDFTITSIPEPSTGWLATVGSICLVARLVVVRRRVRH